MEKKERAEIRLNPPKQRQRMVSDSESILKIYSLFKVKLVNYITIDILTPNAGPNKVRTTK